jgi:hypothetical protein
MEFLNPGFLYALAALAIPIIIHLFNFRRFKRVPFTNVRFLKEIKVQTTNQNRLKHLLILLMRLLALTFLILAFAQPFIPEEENQKEETGAVSVFIDNSFSMDGESADGPMLEVAKNRALDIGSAYSSRVRFQALTQDFEGRDQYLISSNEFSKRIEDVVRSPKSRELSEILERQQDLLAGDEISARTEIFIISDFQKSRFNFEGIRPDSSLSVNLVQLEPSTEDNIYIDSVWFESPVRKIGTSEALRVRIVNTGRESLSNIPLKLSINGRQRAIGSFGVEGESQVDTSLYFTHETPGIKRLTVSVDDYPITYDDDYFLAYQVFEKINVLKIGNETGKKDFLGAIFKTDSSYNYSAVSIRQLDYSSLKNQDLIALVEPDEVPSGLSAELKTFVEDGGTLWIIPSYKADLESYNEFLLNLGVDELLGLQEGENKVRSINTDHPIYRGVFEKIPNNPDLPFTTSYYRLQKRLRYASDDLMTFGNGDAFLTSYKKGPGSIFLNTVALHSDLNNFSGHALFVATSLRIAELSRATAVNSVELDEESNFNIAIKSMGSDNVFHLISEDGENDVIPPHIMRNGIASISLGPSFNSAGNYNVLLGEDTLSAVGVNFPRSESQRTVLSKDELSEKAGELGFKLFDGNSKRLQQEVSQLQTGTQLWKICIILALIFLLGESLLLRLYKR